MPLRRHAPAPAAVDDDYDWLGRLDICSIGLFMTATAVDLLNQNGNQYLLGLFSYLNYCHYTKNCKNYFCHCENCSVLAWYLV